MSKNIWQDLFYKEGSGFRNKKFAIIHPGLPRFIKLLKEIKAKRVLDLGAGTGRHTILLAQEDFQVYGIDIAEKALRLAKERLDKENLKANLRSGDIYKKLPYKDNFFDGVLSIAVLHHAKVSKIKSLIKELTRVMKKGGILMIEVPLRKGYKHKYEELEPGTLVPSDGTEKGIPHHLFKNKNELKSFFPNFEILDIYRSEDQIQTFSPHYTMFTKLKNKS
jgi:ubiquinone/menaquinone biosynthesis C-methylase UbiE